jgi:hypothetical protein
VKDVYCEQLVLPQRLGDDEDSQQTGQRYVIIDEGNKVERGRRRRLILEKLAGQLAVFKSFRSLQTSLTHFDDNRWRACDKNKQNIPFL